MGAMWGSFFIFRVLEFFVFPLSILINSEHFKNPGLINIWFSAILGVFTTEWYFSVNQELKTKIN
jgi:hypothetical protein